MSFTPVEIMELAGVGFAAGVLGGLLGIGGSVIMIPALAIIFGTDNPESQHQYQAAAMMVNVAVSFPAALKHRQQGAIRGDLFRILLPSAMVAIVAGVIVSNFFSGGILRRLFALFLLYVVATNIAKLVLRKPDFTAEESKVTVPRAGAVGGIMGFMAGLLGIGGGVLATPLMQVLCRLPLRQCIGASSAVMCLTAAVGSTLKVATLPEHGFPWWSAVVLASLLAPTAFLGGHLGAKLTHALPLPVVRVVLVLLLVVAAWRMAVL